MHKELHGKHHTYKIDSVLGRGAMGVVCQATIVDTDETVAIKTLRQDLLSGSERDSVLGRFMREVDISMGLNHPNIVKVLDSGKGDDTTFLAMEIISGKELKDFLDNLVPLPMETIIQIMVQLLDGIDYSARQGVIHRDIKPANIMVRDDFFIKIMDFGIARMESSEMTQAGDMLGTPAYMSPEQIMGSLVDGGSDIFSAGVVLYQLLTGVKPFKGQLAAIMHQIINEMPPPPSSLNGFVPKSLDAVVLKALAKERDSRFSTASEFSMALRLAWDKGRKPSLANDEDQTMVVESDATMVTHDSNAFDGNSVERLNSIAQKIEEILEIAISTEVTPKIFESIKGYFKQYSKVYDGAERKDLRIDPLTERHNKLYIESSIESLKDIIIKEAPLPGKEISLDDRSDWMLCIDLFSFLGERAATPECADTFKGQAQAIRAELLTAAMMYANQINQLLFSPDHLDLTRVSADFMRLDILQWGLEELDGQQEVGQMHNNIRMFAGQVLQKVNASILDFINSKEVLARFDMANMLLYIDELIVIATRIIESPQSGASAMPAQNLMGQGIILQFIDNACKVAEIFVEELLLSVLDQDLNQDSFESKLRLLGRLYQFSVIFDDESCRVALKRLTETVYQGALGLTEKIKGLLDHMTIEGVSENEQQKLLHGLLNTMYDLAEDLGWVGLSQSLMMKLRDYLLATDEDATVFMTRD